MQKDYTRWQRGGRGSGLTKDERWRWWGKGWKRKNTNSTITHSNHGYVAVKVKPFPLQASKIAPRWKIAMSRKGASYKIVYHWYVIFPFFWPNFFMPIFLTNFFWNQSILDFWTQFFDANFFNPHFFLNQIILDLKFLKFKKWTSNHSPKKHKKLLLKEN